MVVVGEVVGVVFFLVLFVLVCFFWLFPLLHCESPSLANLSLRTCQVNVKLNPHPLSPLWPDSSNKTGYGMLGPYDAWLTGSRILFKVSYVEPTAGLVGDG